MKRSILTGIMIIGLAATSAFAVSTKDTKQGAGSKAKPAAATQPAASTGGTMAAGTHKRRHHHRRHHQAVAHKHATPKSK